MARIEHAYALASEALADVYGLLDAEPTEAAFALALKDPRPRPRREGRAPVDRRERPNTAKPHHGTSDRPIRDGDCLILDFGTLFDGYHSDVTRTALLGDVDPWLVEAFAAVEDAGRGGGGTRPALAGPTSTICRPPRGRRLRRALRPRHRPPGRPADPRGAVGHRQPRRHPVGRGRGDRGASGVYRPGLGDIRIEDSVLVRRRLPPPHAHPEGPVMPAISTNDLKNGQDHHELQLDERLFTVVDFQHVKPGKGGAFVRTKLKNVRTGAVLERTFNAGIRVEQAIVNKRDMQFALRDGDDYVFMDNRRLRPGARAAGRAGRRRRLPGRADDRQPGHLRGRDRPGRDRPVVELTVRPTEPGVQGDRVSGARKPATLETGLVIQVPLFVNPGDRVKVDTRSGEYVTRV